MTKRRSKTRKTIIQSATHCGLEQVVDNRDRETNKVAGRGDTSHGCAHADRLRASVGRTGYSGTHRRGTFLQQITNRAPLCPHHNIRKGNKRIHLSDYREEIAHAGEMLVSRTDDLINLSQAEQWALDIYADTKMRRGHQSSLTR